MNKHNHDSGIVFAISMQDDTTTTYSVDISKAKPAIKNAYDLWVSHEIYDEYSQIASRENLAVVWRDPDNPDPTVGYAGPFKKGPDGKNFAFVWEHPDAWTQLAACSS